MYNIYRDRLLIQKNIYGISLITMRHGMRAGAHSTLGSSPGSLVFNKYMFFNIPLIADWHTITRSQEHLIHENLMRENQKRGHAYAPQQLVLKKKWKPKKNWAKEQVVHTKKVQVHANGTVTIQLRPGLTERINTWQIIPYKQ